MPILVFSLAVLYFWTSDSMRDRWNTLSFSLPCYAEQQVILVVMVPLTCCELSKRSLLMLWAAPGWLKNGFTSYLQSPTTPSLFLSSNTSLDGSSGTSIKNTSFITFPETEGWVLHFATIPSEMLQVSSSVCSGTLKLQTMMQRQPLITTLLASINSNQYITHSTLLLLTNQPVSWWEQVRRRLGNGVGFYNKTMSQLRDMQRLRQPRGQDQNTLNTRSSQYQPLETYSITFDRGAERTTILDVSSFCKFIPTKEIMSSRQTRASQRKGSSNHAISIESPLLKLSLTAHSRFQPQQQPQMVYREKTRVGMEEGVNGYQVICAVGKGGFGKVWKVQTKKNREVLAMKQMSKARIIAKKSIGSVMGERMLLGKLRHPFIVNMRSAFQDREHLYLVLDYVEGGDLRFHLCQRRLTESQSKFFISCLIVGLQYLYQQRVIHRDLKPQNLVLDSQGYLRITDLGVSRELRQDNHQDTSGTPGYMSPEVMCRRNHSFPADYFAVGVIAYEFMLGRRPYTGANRKEIRDQILSKQAMVKPEELPHRWSLQSMSFVNQLLQRNPTLRLGATGIAQLKKHDWLKNVDFCKLQRRQLIAPFIPATIQSNYQQYKKQISEDTLDQNRQENSLMLRDQQVQSLFQGYDYPPE